MDMLVGKSKHTLPETRVLSYNTSKISPEWVEARESIVRGFLGTFKIVEEFKAKGLKYRS